MKNVSGRNASFGWQFFVLLLAGVISGIAAVLLYVRFEADWNWFVLPAVCGVALIVLVTMNTIRGQAGGKIMNVFFIGSKDASYFAAVDSYAVFETEIDYETRHDVDHVRERIQIVDIPGARRVFESSGKSTRANDLKLEAQTAESAVFRSRNTGRFSLNFSSGVVQFDAAEPRKPDSLRESVRSQRMRERYEAFDDKSVQKMEIVNLPDGKSLELRGNETTQLYSGGRKLTDKVYAGAGFLRSDDADSRAIVFSSPAGALLHHAERRGRHQVLCFSRISSSGKALWTLGEHQLFRRPRTDSGRTRLHSVYGNEDAIVLIYTLPPRWGDLAFAIASDTGRPIWKYVF